VVSEESEGVPREYPEAILAEIETRMTEADPQSDVVLEFACDACRHDWTTTFDIGHFLWEEISARAARLLLDVHLLARAYGWTESEVLMLSDARRAAYIDMVSA
jgi:hypothetical protein